MEVILSLHAEAVLYMFGPLVRLLRGSVPCIASCLGKTTEETCPSTVPRLASIHFGKGAKIRSSFLGCRSEPVGTARHGIQFSSEFISRLRIPLKPYYTGQVEFRFVVS
jgi:hypothetical protein